MPESEHTADSTEQGDVHAARFRTILQNIPDYAIFMIDPQGFVVEWSDGAQRVKGYTPKEAIGLHLSVFYTPMDRADGSVERELDQAAREGRTERENWRVRKGGEWFWGNEIATAIRDSDGKLVGFTKITRDLTQRKAMEDELRQSEERYRMLLQNVRDYAILTLDPLGRITSWNTGAQGIFGYDEHEIVGQEGRVLFTPQDRAENVPKQELATAAREGRASDDRWQSRRDGTVFWASGVTMPMRDPDGTLRGFNKVLRDLTQAKVLDEHRDRLLEQEKTARLEAERAITMKDEFIAVVSHELRTPLTSVILWAGMLRSGTMKQSEMDEALEIIERSAAAQQQLIDDLLDVSRMLSGKLRIKILEIDLVPSLQAAIDAVRPMALTKNIAIESILDERAGRVSADPDRIQQVLWNLLNNAVKFTPAGGKVTVQLDRIDDTLQIKVADTGRGISHSFLPFVFDRFRQADSSSTRRYGGLGLGLAITRQLVELHGGTIRAESPGEGKGTTFIIELPLADVRLTAQSDSHRIEQPHGSSQHSARPDLSGRRILIVEDESDTRLALKKLLQQCQAVVAAVDSAAAAIALLQQSPGTSSFDVLISDIGMPGEDGYQLIRQVRAMERAAKTLSTPAIALSAYAREEDRLKAVSAGFQAHVAKPVKPSELLEVLVSLTLTSRKGNAANHHNP